MLGKATDINKDFVFGKYINYSMLYQIYNHLALGPTALVLSDYKSNAALVGVL